MEHLVIIVNGWKLLTIITKSSILDVAAVLDPSLWLKFISFLLDIGESQDTLLYHLYPLHGHVCVSWTITAENSPLHIASVRTRTENIRVHTRLK